ncbi:MAG: hypothetical protein JWR14_4945, partial [Caballeronia sp.]|nr:hypothetical protein [Caballeronia sp.]
MPIQIRDCFVAKGKAYRAIAER